MKLARVMRVVGAVLLVLLPGVVLADHCLTPKDCHGTVRGAVTAIVGLGVLATLLSIGLDVLPGVGTVKGVIEAITGRDPVTGEELAWWERLVGVLPGAALIDVIRAGGRLDKWFDPDVLARTVPRPPRTETPRAEPPRTEPPRTEPPRMDQRPGEPPRTEEPRPGEPGRVEPPRMEDRPREPGRGEPRPGEPRPSEPGRGESRPREPGRGEPGRGEPGRGEPGRGEPRPSEPGRGDSRPSEPGRGEPGRGEPRPGEPRPSEPGRGDSRPSGPGRGEPGRGESGRGESRPGESGTGGRGEPGRGDSRPGEPGRGEPEQGEPRPGRGEPRWPDWGEPFRAEPRHVEPWMTDGGPGRWVDLSVNRSNVSERAADYEEQVTGVPRGMEYQGDAPWRATNTIAFDGYDKASGTLLEAKGLGYAQHLDEDLEPKSYFKKSEKFEEIIGQAEDQYLFAQKHDLHLRWFVAEEKFALALQRRFVQDGLEIKVSYVPPMEKGANAL